MAVPAKSYSFVCGSIADGANVQQNFSDWIGGATDGRHDYIVSQITVAASAVLNAAVSVSGAVSFATNVVLGGSSLNTIQLGTALRPASSGVQNIGSSSAGWDKLYLTGAIGSTSTPDANTLYENMFPRAMGYIGSGGTLIWGVNITSSRTALGTYSITFLRSMASNTYAVILTGVQASGVVATPACGTQLKSGFVVHRATTTPVDLPFHCVVFAD